MPNELNIINIPNIGGYKIALDKESKSLYAAQITSNNYLSGITSSDFFRISQQIFSIPSFDSVQPSGTGIYIDNNGQSKFYDGTDFVDISYEIVSQISVDTIKNDDTVPTTRAVSAFVEKSVPSSIQLSGTIVGTAVFNGSDIRINTSLGDGFSIDASKVQGLTISWNDIQNKPTNIPLSGDVTGTANLVTNTITTTIAGLPWSKIIDPPTIPSINGLATETYVDSKVSGKLNISEFNTFKNNNTNVITSAKTEAITSAKTYTDSVVSSKVNKADIVQNFTELYDNKIPSVKAVADFVNTKEVIPEVYYVPSFDSVDTAISGLYIDYDGEARLYSGDGNWEQISQEIVSSVSANANDDTVPTTKAVYDFVKASLTSSIKAIGTVSTSGALPTNAEINDLYFVGPIDGQYAEYVLTVNGWEQFGIINNIDLSNYATLNQLSSKLDTSEFNTFKNNNTNSITSAKTEAITSAKTYTDTMVSGKLDKSVMILNINSGSANDSTIPTTKAVYDFVNSKEVTPEVFYVETFPTNVTVSGLYINYDGETRFYDNLGNYEQVSYEMVTSINVSSTDNTVPTTKAVYTFVTEKILEVETGSSDISEQLSGKADVSYVDEQDENTLNAANAYTDSAVSSKINTSAIKQVIDSTANDSTIPTTKAVSSYVATTINNKSEVEILNSFPATGKADTIYVNSNSNEAKYYNSGWQNLSIKAIRNMTGNETDDVVPTTQAVAKFLEPKLAAKSEISISNQLPTTGQDNILYISETGQTAVNINGELTNISVDVIDDIALTGNDKNIPTSVAVSAFIDYKLNGESYVDNTNSIIELTPESNVSYKFNIPATAVTINIVQNITNTVIQFETGLSCTYAFSISDTYKINKQFALEDNKSYIIIIDNGLIVWSQIENYQGE